MSRFYHALKGASVGLSGNREEEGPKPVVAIPAPDPMVETEGMAASADRVEIPDVSPLEDVWNSLGTPPAPSHAYGRHTDVKLDQTARLIPHVVDPAVVEHYRRLRTKLMQQHSGKPFKSLLVTSPNPGEGKSVTVLNLGLSFAMLPSFRVVVVDGDLRKASMGKWLGVADKPGLSNLIDGSARLEDVVLKSDESPMCFVVSGVSQTSPGELLNSPDLQAHIRKLTEHFDMVLVDSPPVNLITDAQLLAASCDAILVVARAFSTTRKALEKTVQDLAPFRVIGTILNGGVETKGRGYHYGYRGY